MYKHYYSSNIYSNIHILGLPFIVQSVKNLPCNAGDLGLIPGSGRPPGEGNGNPLQYSCLENPLDREACWVTIHGVTESRTRLSTIFILVPNWKSSKYPRVEWMHWDLSMDINYIVMKMNNKDETCKHKTEWMMSDTKRVKTGKPICVLEMSLVVTVGSISDWMQS